MMLRKFAAVCLVACAAVMPLVGCEPQAAPPATPSTDGHDHDHKDGEHSHEGEGTPAVEDTNATN